MVKIIVYGLGAIGASIAKLALEKEGLELTGVIDNDKAKIGRDVGELLGTDKKGIIVSERLDKKADVVLHSTSSSLKIIKEQLANIIKSGSNVISTCEELSFPIGENVTVAKEIDELAKKNNVTVIGTGINPGFALDSLIIFLTTVSRDIKEIKASRIVDVSKRRIQLQKKVGVGLNIDEFNNLVKEGKIRHVGLPESAAMIASIFGINIKNIKESIKPVVLNNKVIGIKQKVSVKKDGKKFVRLNLQMSIGTKQKDVIFIDGNPPINLVIKEGIHGDVATANIIVNLINKIINNKDKGLIYMKDLVTHI